MTTEETEEKLSDAEVERRATLWNELFAKCYLAILARDAESTPDEIADEAVNHAMAIYQEVKDGD